MTDNSIDHRALWQNAKGAEKHYFFFLVKFTRSNSSHYSQKNLDNINAIIKISIFNSD